MTPPECIVCTLGGNTLCAECKRDHDRVAKMEGHEGVLRWAAERAAAAERARLQALAQSTITKWGAAMSLLDAFDGLLKSEIHGKLTRLDAAIRVVRKIERAQQQKKKGRRK